MSHSGFLTLLGLTGNRNQKSEGRAIASGLRWNLNIIINIVIFIIIIGMIMIITRDLVMEQHRTLFYTVRLLLMMMTKILQ